MQNKSPDNVENLFLKTKSFPQTDAQTELEQQNRVPSSSMSESPSLANLQNKQNRDQQYLAVRCQSNRNSNSNESGSYKAEGNGKDQLTFDDAIYLQ